jgi:predicted RNA binding protein YcfA (HicA-like mRNA interferase family)
MKKLLEWLAPALTASFENFEGLLKRAGWVFDRQKGSHRIWYSPKRPRIYIQRKGGRAIRLSNFSKFTTERKTARRRARDRFDGYAVELFLDEDNDWLAHLGRTRRHIGVRFNPREGPEGTRRGVGGR